MEISSEVREWGTLLKASGSVDVHTRQELTAHPVLRAAAGNVVLDLSGVDFIDSSGMGTLVQIIRSFRGGTHRFILAGPSESVRKILQFTSVNQIVRIASSPEEAGRWIQEPE